MRRDPINRLWREHTGVDIVMPVGTPVYSPVDGQIVGIYSHSSGGKTLVIKSDRGELRFGFCHLSDYKVHRDQCVRPGDIIALSGNTGRTTGPHLHFSVKQGGEWVEGLYYGGEYVDPVIYIEINDE